MLIWWGQWIPWISDPDNLGSMLYLGPYFNLLPIFAVAFMVVQQKMMSPPAKNEEQEMQQKTMQIMMGVMGIFFYKMAAGLCLYFIASSMWGLAERKLLPKKSVKPLSPQPPWPKQCRAPAHGPRERDREKDEPETRMTKLKAWWQKLLESRREEMNRSARPLVPRGEGVGRRKRGRARRPVLQKTRSVNADFDSWINNATFGQPFEFKVLELHEHRSADVDL